jgi:dihydroorotase
MTHLAKPSVWPLAVVSAATLLLGLAWKWAEQDGVPLARALAVLTQGPAAVLGHSLGTLASSIGRVVEGGVADLCVIDPKGYWTVGEDTLRSRGKHTPFGGHELPVSVRATLVAGQLAYDAQAASRA